MKFKKDGKKWKILQKSIVEKSILDSQKVCGTLKIQKEVKKMQVQLNKSRGCTTCGNTQIIEIDAETGEETPCPDCAGDEDEF